MANEVETRNEPSLTSLVSGIVNDAQELVKQQLQMFKAELREDAVRVKDGSIAVAAGLGVSLLGLFLLALSLAHLLQRATGWPEWGCEGLVSLLFLAVGASLFWTAKQKFARALPEQSVEALRENVQWLTKPK